jgi:hypothetical protein
MRTPEAIRDKTDWKLNPKWFKKLEEIWGPHTVDLFSGPNNGQMSRRFSITEGDSEATGHDAFKQSWTTENAYGNPPYEATCFQRLIDKTMMDQATLTVIAPVWRKASWYQNLVMLSCDFPRLLPHSADLFLPGPTNDHGVGQPPWAESMAVRISGDGEKRAAFQRTAAALTLLPTIRAAGYSPSGRKLPFFDMRGVPVKFDARIPGERKTVTTSTANTAPLEVAAGVVEDENGDYEVIQMEAKPRQKAYARIIAAGFPKVTLFDTGSQGDLMSLHFYRERCRAQQLRVAQMTVQGVNKMITRPEGITTTKLSIADR